MRLLISGGGTGGHVYPALSVVDEIRKQAKSTDSDSTADHGAAAAFGGRPRNDSSRPRTVARGQAFLYLGRTGAIEERLAQHYEIPFEQIDVGAVRGLAPWTAARNLVRLIRTIGCVRAVIRTFQPDVVFATGGYVSAPVIWASAREHVPSVIYLPDLEPGWAVTVTARWATRVAVSFDEVVRLMPKGKAVVTGYPVRHEFFETDRVRARQMFHLDPDTRTVTIFGGSRGAHHINQAALANMGQLSRLAQIVLITGRDDEEWAHGQVQVLSEDLAARVRVYGYLEEQLPNALAAADIVVARAGAATLGEFPALGLPAILVPYPYAGRHQERNAEFMVEHGAAVKLDDHALEQQLVPTIQSLFDAPEQLHNMAKAARAMAQPGAAGNLVAVLNSLVGKQE